MARNINHNQRMRDERREMILSCARRLFAAKGLAATKISDIAGEVGMAQGLLYHYFRSKEEIFTEIVREAFAKMNEAVRILDAMPLPARAKIRLAIVELVRSIDESEDFANTVLLNAQAGISDATPVEAQAIIRAESGVPYTIIARIMREGQRDVTIKPFDAEQLSMVFWTMIKGLALHKAVNGTAYQTPDIHILTGMFFTDNAIGDDHE